MADVINFSAWLDTKRADAARDAAARAEFATDERHKALHDLIATTRGRYHWGREWSDLPERSFAHAGTNVNTVTLRIQKPRN